MCLDLPLCLRATTIAMMRKSPSTPTTQIRITMSDEEVKACELDSGLMRSGASVVEELLKL